MQLKIKHQPGSRHPLRGLLIKGDQPRDWAMCMQDLGLSLEQVSVFPIPGKKANSIAAALLVLPPKVELSAIGLNEYCQLIGENLFIPAHAVLVPELNPLELNQLLLATPHLFHPEYGLVELKEAVDWEAILTLPELKLEEVIEPAHSIFIPKEIRSFQIAAVSPEEVLEDLEKKEFPKQKKLKNEPLNFLEKARLIFYRGLLTGIGASDGKIGELLRSSEGLKELANRLQGDSKWSEKMINDFEQLEQRNQNELDKLLNMLKDDPEEALKYAIPLDQKGASRGPSSEGGFNMTQRWFNWGLFNNMQQGVSGGGAANLGDDFYTLLNQYNRTAEDLIAKGNFAKAAFVYLKLLNNPLKAAQTLEAGKLYMEAASIYLEKVKDKNKAAECYEKGNYIEEAIKLYKELKKHEKVGDLYVQLNQRQVANLHYQKVVDDFATRSQFLKAALLCKNKMLNAEAGQDLLLQGWKKYSDGFNCLNNYFNNIEDEAILLRDMHTLYKTTLISHNREDFIRAIKIEYKKRKEVKANIREIAYEIISKYLEVNPNIAGHLIDFNKKDTQLVKDTIRYKINKKP